MTDCATKSVVPLAECLALVELYTQTNGSGWISRTNWLNFGSQAPCGWFGVDCSPAVDGLRHVRRVILPANGLSGTLPLELGHLTELRRLRLENNALHGRVPPTLCALTNLEVLNLDYNALFSQRRSVNECLAALDEDWAATQTVAVRRLRLTEILTDTLILSWTPISYTEGGGYYEIATGPDPIGPFTMRGTTTDKLATGIAITGLTPGTSYFVRVRTFTPAHDDQTNDLRSNSAQVVGVTEAESGRVLVAAYFPADNDLSSEVPYVVERIRRGTLANPNVRVVMLVDGNRDGDTHIIELSRGEIVTTSVVIDNWGVNELDTADPAVLAWFLQHARTTYPSEREVAAIIGHGVALAPEVEWPDSAATLAAIGATQSDKIPPLPKEHEYSPSDVTNRGYMSAVDVGEALMAATDNGANPFDLIFFDQCFQGSVDTLYEVRNSAEVYVASPNYAWLVAAYDRYLARFTPTTTPQQMALAIVNQYENSLNNRHPNAILSITNANLLALATQVSELADALLAAAQANEHQKIGIAAQQSQYVDTTQCGERNLQLGPPDELIGLESFAQGLLAQFGPSDPYGIATSISGLQTIMTNILKRSIVGNPYLAPDQTWDYQNTLTVLAPLPRNSPSRAAWRASIYREDVPFGATWTVSPTEPISVTASLAFVRDGRWDEFLAEWYIGLEPTVGQWCHYVPPPQVVVSESESLSLTVSAVTTDSVQLAWTPTDSTAATEYWLYSRDPFAVGWQMGQAISLSVTTLALAPLEPGVYGYMVVARNDELETIAQSNEVTVTITGGPSQEILLPLHMPFVSKD